MGDYLRLGLEPETAECLQGILRTFSPLPISGLSINGSRFYKGIIYSRLLSLSSVGVFTLKEWLFLFLCHCKQLLGFLFGFFFLSFGLKGSGLNCLGG